MPGQPRKKRAIALGLLGLTVVATVLVILGRNKGDLIPLRVRVDGRSVSKLPFVIAMDQELYQKHGLDVSLRLPSPDFEEGRQVRADGFVARTLAKLGLRQLGRFDIKVDGWTPYMVRRTIEAREPHLTALASTDCVLRAHIVAQPEIQRLEELEGRRIGVSYLRATTGFGALVLAERMGWDPKQDISIMLSARDIGALRDGVVDAVVASERVYSAAKTEGYSILADTRDWNESLAGNSVLVREEWLQDPANREAARRFLMATTEAIALYHQNRELVLDVLARWNGVTDQEYALTMYDRGQWIPRAPFPCYVGIERTMELYDSNEMRRYAPGDFYDDSIMRQIVDDGFLDGLYDQPVRRKPK